MKLLRGSVLVVASHNAGKVREFRELLLPLHFQIKDAGELHLPEPEEVGITFAENAALKARAAAQATGLYALADDSGLAVGALGGEPGVYSARWAGPNRNFDIAMEEVHRKLVEKRATDFSARFVCALALAEPHGSTEMHEAQVRGHLEFPPRGNRGFGYDPIFVPEGLKKTFGEIDPTQKLAMSHRTKAFELLRKSIQIEERK
jgi:XTP/dITP diphosphohydrolase